MTIYSAYDEIADILSAAGPARIMQMQAAPEMQARLEILIERSKEGELTKSEKDELDHYIVLERIVRLAKIRSRARLVFT